MLTYEQASDKVIIALDCSKERAFGLADMLAGKATWVKVGMTLFYAEGPAIVDAMRERGLRVFLDLKVHDIPFQVQGAVRAASLTGADILSIHGLGSSAMIAAARTGAEEAAEQRGGDRTRLVAISVLTSMDQAALAEIGVESPVAEEVARLASLAYGAGADGIVCSPQEAAEMRALLGPDALIVTPGVRPAGAEVGDQKRIAIGLKEGITEKLYIEVEAEADGHRSVAVIAGGHTTFVYVERDGEVHCVGRTMRRERELRVMGDSIFSHILSYTSAACDARMAGAMIPVMSNSGSGNQGIAATLPVVVYAEETGASEEQTVRALVLSHLTVIYIKQSLGRLSALCGCVVAATGSSCGITYLMGGGYEQVVAAVKNMIANLTGMICDGAKPSCAMKLTSGVSTAVLSAMMAMDGHCVTPVEGIIEEDVDRCIRNLTTIGRDGMNETDRLVLDIMTHKHPAGWSLAVCSRVRVAAFRRPVQQRRGVALCRAEPCRAVRSCVWYGTLPCCAVL